MGLSQYFAEIERKVRTEYSVAQEARNRNLDPLSTVEVPLARSLAEKVTALISVKYPQVNTPQISKRILELEKEYGQLDPAVAIIISEEVSNEKFCKFRSKLEAIDAGIRVGLAYTTMGVVSSPLEGFTELKLGKTAKGEEYFMLYFSGPIRSAGGTAAAFCVVLADYLREKFGYAKYDATEQEVKRTVTEILDYHERITNLQYLPSEKEIEIIARNIPVQVTGEPSEDKEVSNYKDCPRIDSNLLRSGFCLVLAEGIAQKAAKVIKIVNGLNNKNLKLSSWAFLQDVTKLQKKEIASAKPSPSSTFIKDIVAGRPIFTHPSRRGGFRLRYGRTRTSGYSTVAIHPAVMSLMENFIAIGTQFRTERPGKSAAVVSCDSLLPPLVKLANGNILYLNSVIESEKFKSQVKEILYIGDILVSYGDFINRNHVLMPPGYSEEQWFSELKSKMKEKNILEKDIKKINPLNISFEEAKNLSRDFGVPLHPNFIFYWTQICSDDFLILLEWLKASRFEEKIVLPYNSKFELSKRVLEILGVPHIVTLENIVLSEKDSESFLLNIGISKKEELENLINSLSKNKEENILDFINKSSKFKIEDKAGTFIGTRMGRPEKAKLRKLDGSPNVLFPVGEAGGRMRSVKEACNSSVKADFPIYFCNKCNLETIYFLCENCGEETKKMYFCRECANKIPNNHCSIHGENSINEYTQKRLDMQHYLNAAISLLGLTKLEIPDMIKGVRGTSSGQHIPENLAKGILRAIYNLTVNKDGTIRYDCTELPITYFKSKEIKTSVEKLKELGYTKDKDGEELQNDDQILELKPHDIILPCCPDSLDENADIVFKNIAKFIDDLLVRFYKQKPFYNIKKTEDLAGHLVACIAPHNSACVVARIIGFSSIQALLASPFMHAAMRRDCDGDEAAIMLLLDVFLNFSKKYLPSHRGATQDAPLILNARLRVGEVDDMVFDMETVKDFPLELYTASKEFGSPASVKVAQVKSKLLDGDEAFQNMNYTHETSNINLGVTCSAYKKLATMQEKVKKQMEIAEKIRAVDVADMAKLVIERHLIRDIKGNLRKFSMQQFRCVKCNEKFRRPPLAGVCSKCSGKILFTISEGGIIKYLEPALQLAIKYDVPNYIKQSLEITKKHIESIFGRETEKQEAIQKWF